MGLPLVITINIIATILVKKYIPAYANYRRKVYMARGAGNFDNQQGFGSLGLLLIGVILLIIGIGVYVFTQRPDSKQTSTASSAASANTGTSTSPGGVPGGADSGSAGGATNTTNIIKITPVGLQLTVPDSLKDLTYALKPVAGGATEVTFSTKTLASRVPSCAADQGSGAFQTVTRGTGSYPGPANPSSGALIKQYGDYYFAYTLPTGPCAKGLSVDNQNLLNSLAQDFSGALPSVTALL